MLKDIYKKEEKKPREYTNIEVWEKIRWRKWKSVGKYTSREIRERALSFFLICIFSNPPVTRWWKRIWRCPLMRKGAKVYFQYEGGRFGYSKSKGYKAPTILCWEFPFVPITK